MLRVGNCASYWCFLDYQSFLIVTFRFNNVHVFDHDLISSLNYWRLVFVTVKSTFEKQRVFHEFSAPAYFLFHLRNIELALFGLISIFLCRSFKVSCRCS